MDFKNTLTKLLFFTTLFFISIISQSYGQNKNHLNQLVYSYKQYTELPREIGYVHLNKTTLLQGEILGFTAYIFDKSEKKSSLTATNIYYTISDSRSKIIKSEMLLGDNGIANGSFQLDSIFKTGDYTVRAYTNWMRNFEEQNYFVQEFRILNSEESKKTPTVFYSKIDAQFLAEGGHFVEDVNNSVGVIIKDSLGYGISEVIGKVIDSDKNTLTDFKTNKYGIGKFSFIPKSGENYKVVLNVGSSEKIAPIEKAKIRGIAMAMNNLDNKLAISFRTNKNTLDQIKTKNYILAIHNGNILKTVDVSFEKSQEVIKIINYTDLNPGINILTLFDENNQAILERIFFNYEGINLLTAGKPQLQKSKDSISIKIPFKNIIPNTIGNFSISVLPTETKSYNPNHNIISATYLQPYIKSIVEDASYYFTDITRNKKFELDNVMLTQGWSSYDWNNVFNRPPKANYDYENGISFKAHPNNKTASEYMMYASINNEMQLFDLDKNDKDFGATGLYPMEAEKIRFSAVKKNKNIERPNLYFSFSPSKIPDLNKTGIFVSLKTNKTFEYLEKQILQTSWDKTEELDEVVVKAHKIETRQDMLTRNAFGNVDVIDDMTRSSYIFLSNYIRSKGFRVYEKMGEVLIINPRPTSFGQEDSVIRKPVKVYLDDIPLLNTDILYKYTMDEVDYIFFDKSGTSEGGAGATGVIKIFTDPTISQSKMNRNVSQDISMPLTFSNPKKFYVPEYSSYNGDFYRDYGVIDWFPTLRMDRTGKLQFTIATPKTPNISLFIEGMTMDGSLISDTMEIGFE